MNKRSDSKSIQNKTVDNVDMDTQDENDATATSATSKLDLKTQVGSYKDKVSIVKLSL